MAHKKYRMRVTETVEYIMEICVDGEVDLEEAAEEIFTNSDNINQWFNEVPSRSIEMIEEIV